MRLFVIALAFAILTVTPSAAQTTEVQVGRLACEVDGGLGLILGSNRALTCQLHREGYDSERYSGEISRFGIDIGFTEAAHVEWLVFTATDIGYAPGALAGNFVGISSEATLGVGLGANLLVGGSSDSFTLQPLSVQAQIGLNIALGIAELRLRAN
jgi:hypothetical protein